MAWRVSTRSSTAAARASQVAAAVPKAAWISRGGCTTAPAATAARACAPCPMSAPTVARPWRRAARVSTGGPFSVGTSTTRRGAQCGANGKAALFQATAAQVRTSVPGRNAPVTTAVATDRAAAMADHARMADTTGQSAPGTPRPAAPAAGPAHSANPTAPTRP